MNVTIAVPDEHINEDILDAGLEMNTRVNEAMIKAGDAPNFGQLINSGAKWHPEPPGVESFDNGKKVALRGHGDCDDWGPIRAASLRVSGEDPKARSVSYKSGPNRWHAIVKRGNGTLEDPSQTAGMRVRPGTEAAGIPPAVVGCMHSQRGINGPVRPFVAVRRDDNGWMARTDLPIVGADGYAVSVRHHGPSPARALGRCMAGAALVGHCARVADAEHLDKLWALQGLLCGQSLADVAATCGADVAREAVESLAQLAPDILRELREHRAATEGGRRAGHPFP